MLVYRNVENLELVGYTDSNNVGCANDMKSTSSYVFMLIRGAVSWKSANQTPTTSIMHAEFIACYGAAIPVVWLRNLITGLQIVNTISRLTLIYYDISGVMFFPKNNKITSGQSI